MTEKKFTDEEIKKALECCARDYAADCDHCVLNDLNRNDCYSFILHKLSLDLINRYEAEIERLKEKSIADDKLLNDRVQEAINAVRKANQKYVDALEEAFNDRTAELKTAKAEAIKEFAERLINKSKKRVSDVYGSRVYIQDVNALVKEMTEGQK